MVNCTDPDRAGEPGLGGDPSWVLNGKNARLSRTGSIGFNGGKGEGQAPVGERVSRAAA